VCCAALPLQHAGMALAHLSQVLQTVCLEPLSRTLKPSMPTATQPKVMQRALCIIMPMHKRAAISTAAPHMYASTESQAPDNCMLATMQTPIQVPRCDMLHAAHATILPPNPC
jgi:hypothetical protein